MTEQLTKKFVLVTGGEDPEIDVIGVIVAAIKDAGLGGADIARVLHYLDARYSSRSLP